MNYENSKQYESPPNFLDLYRRLDLLIGRLRARRDAYVAAGDHVWAGKEQKRMEPIYNYQADLLFETAMGFWASEVLDDQNLPSIPEHIATTFYGRVIQIGYNTKDY